VVERRLDDTAANGVVLIDDSVGGEPCHAFETWVAYC
jgi:hypothetical protein